uniref:Uncharacterized protein n=1 Tax=Cacopsylla melanoneura TaxID=428564 RepID=A0A8D8LL65_9HEMI
MWMSWIKYLALTQQTQGSCSLTSPWTMTLSLLQPIRITNNQHVSYHPAQTLQDRTKRVTQRNKIDSNVSKIVFSTIQSVMRLVPLDRSSNTFTTFYLRKNCSNKE